MAETETDKSSAASSVEKGSSGKPHSIITYGINIAITTANHNENILDRRLKRAAVDFAEIIAANQLAAVQ